MDQIQPQNKSLPWIIFTIEANIAIVALFIGFSQLFFQFLPVGFLQSYFGRISLSIAIIALLSAQSTRMGVRAVLRRTLVKDEDILKISFWVGAIPLVLAVGFFIINKATYSNLLPALAAGLSYGFFTYFWLKKLSPQAQLGISSSFTAPIAPASVSFRLKRGLIIGLVLVAALVTFTFLKYNLEQKLIEKIVKNENREEIQKKLLEQFLPKNEQDLIKTINGGIYYKNKQFGFSLEFPPSWEDLIVTESMNYFGAKNIEFGLPGRGTEDLFAIEIFDEKNWQIMVDNKDEYVLSRFLGEKNDFFFKQAISDDDGSFEQRKEIPIILSTFKFSEEEQKITGSFIKVLSPNGGESIKKGEVFDISWNSSGDIPWVRITLLASTKLPVETEYSGAIDLVSGGAEDARLLKNFKWVVDFKEFEEVGSDIISQYKYYKISIRGLNEKPGALPSKIITEDLSDNYFSIIE